MNGETFLFANVWFALLGLFFVLIFRPSLKFLIAYAFAAWVLLPFQSDVFIAWLGIYALAFYLLEFFRGL